MMVIKYYEWLKILPDEKHAIYELCVRDDKSESGVRKIKELDKQSAMAMIADKHMQVVCKNKYGIIWE